MKQKLFILLGLGFLIMVLIGLNAVSFSQKEKQPDAEIFPNRSTFNVGATGARAFYDLLAETGRRPMRWTEPPAALLTETKNQPSVFVVIGSLKTELTDDEAAQILKWVSTGGRLVVIDREPPPNLVKTTANWSLSFNSDIRRPVLGTDASDQQQMTTGIKAARAAQPSVYTKGINGVQSSVFAASINFQYFGAGDEPKTTGVGIGSGKLTPAPTFSRSPKEIYEPPANRFSTPTPSPTLKPSTSGSGSGNGYGRGDGLGSGDDEDADEPAIVVRQSPARPKTVDRVETVALDAPVVHLSADQRNLLVDVPYGSGKIVFLSDPYIVANSGISLVDNAHLAVNLVSTDGIIAFDEYHQGYGSNQNRLLQYFAGTPVIAVVVQILLLIGLVLFSQSRRFARALPENEPNRLSKLEYVSAMAELQRRTKAFDLAIENIYTDFRRRTARLVGVDNFSTRRDRLAQLIAERLPEENAAEIDELMRKCEDIMHGEPSNKKEILRLTARLREIEEKLGLQRRKKKK